MQDHGFVYIMSNPEYVGKLKVGKTKSHQEVRAKQLSSQTGAIGKFRVEWHMKVSNMHIAELVLHDALSQFYDCKEYFKVDVRGAIQTANSVLLPLFNTLDKCKGLWRAQKIALKMKEELLEYEARQLERDLLKVTF